MRIKIRYAVMSHSREMNVPLMQDLTDKKLYWYVPKSQVERYREAGAKYVVGVNEEQMPMKVHQQNKALIDAHRIGAYLVMLDDDTESFEELTFKDKSSAKKRSVPMDYVTYKVIQELKESPYYLAGLSRNQNPFFNDFKTSNSALIHGQYRIIKPAKNVEDLILSDESKEQWKRLAWHEDIDFSLAHMYWNKGVVQVKSLWAVTPASVYSPVALGGGYYGDDDEKAQELHEERIEMLCNDMYLLFTKWSDSTEDVLGNGWNIKRGATPSENKYKIPWRRLGNKGFQKEIKYATRNKFNPIIHNKYKTM